MIGGSANFAPRKSWRRPSHRLSSDRWLEIEPEQPAKLGRTPLITRRGFLKALGIAALSSFSLAGYAFGIEPNRLRVQRYTLAPPRWPSGLKLKVAALADIHACEPWMATDRIRGIVDVTNALGADVVVLLGDYAAGHDWVTGRVEAKDWADALSGLRAPLGVHAILGNHDWWADRSAQQNGAGPVFGRLALERAGIAVYENDVARLQKDGQTFWLAGLGDQLALPPSRRWARTRWKGVDDLPLTLSKVTDDAPVILLAHEPDIFPKVPGRVAVTLSGHTHGGQIRILGHSPIVPSRFGNRYAYGHVVERRHDSDEPSHMIVSGGLGCSIAPIRFGVVPEIVQIDLGATTNTGT